MIVLMYRVLGAVYGSLYQPPPPANDNFPLARSHMREHKLSDVTRD